MISSRFAIVETENSAKFAPDSVAMSTSVGC